jgi:hypothetical protein
MNFFQRSNRRRFLGQAGSLFGLSLAEALCLRGTARAQARPEAFGRAKRCIVFFAWGGMSQLETWDPKPDAPREFRGDYRSIPTSVPGIRVGEYLPALSRQAHRLTIVRSVHHDDAGHRNAAYWNLTGHPPHRPGNDEAILPSRLDWPCLGAMVARFRRSPPGFPATVAAPHLLADRGLLNGQTSGFLGAAVDPVVIGPEGGQAYQGVSPSSGAISLRRPADLDADRLRNRFDLLANLEPRSSGRAGLDHYRQVASDLLSRSQASAAFDVDREPLAVRAAYGHHVCGRSALMARRLVEAGIPFVMVYPGAGDLNSGNGDMWDTHGQNFPRLRDRLLPPLERASVALLEDLSQRGLLEDTLVVWLTEFGRTPRINGGAGRDHFPNCYSVALAGAGVRQGHVLGQSDRIAAAPVDSPCGPADLHATIFHALGIPLDSVIHDSLGRAHLLTDGRPLSVFE